MAKVERVNFEKQIISVNNNPTCTSKKRCIKIAGRWRKWKSCISVVMRSLNDSSELWRLSSRICDVICLYHRAWNAAQTVIRDAIANDNRGFAIYYAWKNICYVGNQFIEKYTREKNHYWSKNKEMVTDKNHFYQFLKSCTF